MPSFMVRKKRLGPPLWSTRFDEILMVNAPPRLRTPITPYSMPFNETHPAGKLIALQADVFTAGKPFDDSSRVVDCASADDDNDVDLALAL